MLGWALTFLVIALIAAVLGFGGVAAVSVEIAQILFVVFLVLFIVAAVIHAVRGKAPPARRHYAGAHWAARVPRSAPARSRRRSQRAPRPRTHGRAAYRPARSYARPNRSRSRNGAAGPCRSAHETLPRLHPARISAAAVRRSAVAAAHAGVCPWSGHRAG